MLTDFLGLLQFLIYIGVKIWPTPKILNFYFNFFSSIPYEVCCVDSSNRFDLAPVVSVREKGLQEEPKGTNTQNDKKNLSQICLLFFFPLNSFEIFLSGV